MSNCLSIFRKHFGRMTMVSSEKISSDQLQKLASLKEWQQDSRFNIDKSIDAFRCNLEPDFRLSKQQQQIEMYFTLWFQILRRFRKEGVELTPDQYQKEFYRFTSANYVEDYTDYYSDSQVWTREKTHLKMRQAMEHIDISKFFQKDVQKQNEKQKLEKKESAKEIENISKSLEQDGSIKLKQKISSNNQQNTSKKCLNTTQHLYFELVGKIQNEYADLKKFYHQFVYSDNAIVNAGRFSFLQNVAGSAYNQVKNRNGHQCRNRFILTDKLQRQKCPSLLVEDYVLFLIDKPSFYKKNMSRPPDRDDL